LQQPDQLSIFVGSWNMGNAPPPDSLGAWITPGHMLYAIGTQECEYSVAEAESASTQGSGCERDWFASVHNQLGEQYIRVRCNVDNSGIAATSYGNRGGSRCD